MRRLGYGNDAQLTATATDCYLLLESFMSWILSIVPCWN